MICLLFVLRFLCQYTASAALESNNTYTALHLKYNLMMLDFLVQWFGFVVGIYIIMVTPMVGEDGGTFVNKILSKTFVLLRFFLVVMFVLFLGQNIARIDYFTISINWQNWWKDKDENFITNGSWFNAVMCWGLFFAALIAIML